MSLYRFNFTWRCSTVASDINCTGHIRHNTEEFLDDVTADAINDLLFDWYNVGFAGARSAKKLTRIEYVLTSITTRGLEPAPAIQPRILVTNIAGAGNTAGNVALPPNCCTGITLVSTKATRRHRGRMYWPTTESPGGFSAPGILTQTWVDAALPYFKDLLDAISDPTFLGGDAQWCIKSRVEDSTQAVIGFRIGNRIDTQRRRLPREQTYTAI